MKFLVAVVIFLGMVACGEKKAEPKTVSVEQPVVAAPAPTPVVTKDATPVMLEEGMSLDATPVM